MLESEIVRAIIVALNNLPRCRAEKLHGGPMSGHQKLDILCCRDGRLYYLEAKRPGQKPTARQQSTIAKWRATGAVVEVVTSVQEALNIVKGD